ncbi:MAG: glycosyltransferase, partial [Anaeromyxobacteraceae bacterium]
ELSTPVVHTVHHVVDEEQERAYLAHARVQYVAISARQAELSPGLASHVVHHGLDPEAFPAGRGESDRALFIGRLSWCKGPDVAVAAARLANLEVVVAGEVHGEPDDPPAWAAELDRLLSEPGVRRVGPVGGERKQRLLGSARALVMPIRWEEPFGLVMIEAMLSGTPVIAFPRGAAPEVVEDGVTGFLVNDAPEMADALLRAGELDREACRRRARQRFSSTRMVRDYLRVYHAALAAVRRPRGIGAAEEQCHVP